MYSSFISVVINIITKRNLWKKGLISASLKELRTGTPPGWNLGAEIMEQQKRGRLVGFRRACWSPEVHALIPFSSIYPEPDQHLHLICDKGHIGAITTVDN